MFLKQFYIYIFLLISFTAGAQKDNEPRKLKKSASFELSKSLEQGESDEKLALDYEKAAKEQSDKGEYAKAEEYLERAKKLYVKLKNKEKVALMNRELAKVQEAQNKVDEAITNYESVGKALEGKVLGVVSLNDASRLMNRQDPQVQSGYVRQNLDLLNSSTDKYSVQVKEDKASAYKQMAQINLELNKKDEAISNYKEALEVVKDEPAEVIKINREIANVYAEDKQYDKAIKVNERILAKADSIKNPVVKIEQLQTLSSNYIDNKETEKGITVLTQAYELAIEEGRTLEAKKSLDLLADQYKKEKKTQKALEVYADFMDRFETLIKSDSSLIDAKIYQVNEEKISQLEKERALKDELIMKKNRFNYVLIGSIVLILIFLFFIVKALYSIKKRNKKIALQSLRREMNPHFIFNSLNSVNQFIAQNNELEANKYLSSYSKLMRNMMENSNKDFIPLSVELEQLREYLDLEHMRFKDKFSYKIIVDESIDTDAVQVPNMLIQPQLENAIWHGLRYKDGGGHLILDIKQVEARICIIVDDDGIGLARSKELKTAHQKSHQSRGLTNTYERISLLNNLYNSRITIEIREKAGEETGVVVTICFPLSNYTRS